MTRKEAYARIHHLIPDDVLLEIRRGRSPIEAWALHRGWSSPWEIAAAAGVGEGERDAWVTRWLKHAPASTARGAAPSLRFILEAAELLDVPLDLAFEWFYEENFDVRRGR